MTSNEPIADRVRRENRRNLHIQLVSLADISRTSEVLHLTSIPIVSPTSAQ